MRSSLPQFLLNAVMLLLFYNAPLLNAQRVSRVEVAVDNDFFLTFNPTRGTDVEYTHGSRLRAQLLGIPPAIRGLTSSILDCDEPAQQCYSEFELGQEIHTPRREYRDAARPGERPHAGWLYLGIGVSSLKKSVSRTYRLRLGVLGPPALAKEFQFAVHNLFDFREPRGWDHQLPFEPGLVMHVTQSGPLVLDRYQNATLSAGYQISAHVGTVLTQAQAGLEVEWCQGAMLCPGRTELWDEVPFGMRLRAAVSPRVVLQNVFLDGTVFQDSHSVTKKLIVLEASAGVAVRFKAFEIAYELVARGPEYVTEPDGFAYATIQVSYIH